MINIVVARDKNDSLMVFSISWKRDSQKIEKIYTAPEKFKEGKAGYHFASNIIMKSEKSTIKALFEKV